MHRNAFTLHTGALTQRCFSQRQVFTNRCLHIWMLLPRDQEMLLHTNITFMHRRFYQGCCYTEQLSHTHTHTHGCAGTSTQMPLHSVACTQECFCTHVLLHRDSCDTEYPLKTEALTHTHKYSYTGMFLHIELYSYRGIFYTQILLQRSVLVRILLHRDAFTHRCF